MGFWIYLLIFLYVLLPIDFIPDLFVGIGWLDDLLLLGFLGWYHFFYRKRLKGDRGVHHGFDQEARREESRYQDQGGESGSREGMSGTSRQKEAYEILGVKRDASPDEIKAAYRRLVSQYHPDKVVHLGEEFRLLAEKKFKEIQRAYQDLLSGK